VSVPFFVSPFKLFLLMSLLYALPNPDYSRALARLFVPGLDMRIGSAVAVAGIRSTLPRGTEASPEFGPHSARVLRLAGARKQKKQATSHQVGCCLLFAFNLIYVY
jgi:hypothetical protein